MPKAIGDSIHFTGGAEETPKVEVVIFQSPGSMRNGEKTLKITQHQKSGMYQGEVSILLSPETMRDILKWYDRK